MDESKGNWAVADDVVQYKVTVIDFPDRDAQRQQQLQQRQEQQRARQEWQNEHDAKVRAAQQRLESIQNATTQRTNAINSAANQLIAIIEQREQERRVQ